MKVVSYVATPSLLLEWLTKFPIEKMDIVVGANLAQQYKNDLGKQQALIEELTEKLDNGTLRIFIPKRSITMHSKLYILYAQDMVRVLQSSANFTETARQASQQINTTWVCDFPVGEPFLAKIHQDYEEHMEDCILFLDDLRELFKTHSQEERPKIIEAWLRGGEVDDDQLEFPVFMQTLTDQALTDDPESAPIITVRLPDAPKARTQAEKFLAPLKPGKTENTLHVPRTSFLKHVQSQGLPLMVIDPERCQVRLGLCFLPPRDQPSFFGFGGEVS